MIDCTDECQNTMHEVLCNRFRICQVAIVQSYVAIIFEYLTSIDESIEVNCAS